MKELHMYELPSPTTSDSCCSTTFIGWYGCVTLTSLVAAIVFLVLLALDTNDQLTIPTDTVKALLGISIVLTCIGALLWWRRRRQFLYQSEIRKRRATFIGDDGSGLTLSPRSRSTALSERQLQNADSIYQIDADEPDCNEETSALEQYATEANRQVDSVHTKPESLSSSSSSS
jgi:hypothetical protein